MNPYFIISVLQELDYRIRSWKTLCFILKVTTSQYSRSPTFYRVRYFVNTYYLFRCWLNDSTTNYHVTMPYFFNTSIPQREPEGFVYISCSKCLRQPLVGALSKCLRQPLVGALSKCLVEPSGRCFIKILGRTIV